MYGYESKEYDQGKHQLEQAATLSMGVMHCTAVLLDRSSAPRMTVISSSLRSPPSPVSMAWMSMTAFSCARRKIACARARARSSARLAVLAKERTPGAPSPTTHLLEQPAAVFIML